MMQEYVQNSVFFGIFLTIFVYQICLWIQKKWKFPILNPLLISMILIMLFLNVTGIPFETYEYGAEHIGNFLTPVTVCLAVPLYRQIRVLKENMLAIFVSVLGGVLAHAVTVIVLAEALGVDEIFRDSLMGKSLTTAIALGVTSELGGIQGITVIGVCVAGILGAIIGPMVLKLIGVRNPIAYGLALGSASHAVGTSKALECGELQGAMGSLAIVVTGVLTVVIVPILLNVIG